MPRKSFGRNVQITTRPDQPAQMKCMKTLASLLILLTGTVLGLAQGYVNFQNCLPFLTPDPTGGDRLVYDVGSPVDPVVGVGLTGTQYVAELYAGADANSLNPLSDSISRFRPAATATPGCWAN